MAKNNIDKSDMRQVIIDSPRQLEKGLQLAEKVKLEGSFKNVIVCGIGGSALPVNILNALFSNPNVPVLIHRDYNLPKEANENSLIIAISYSGNTEETVSALESAIKNNFKAVAVATGGKIESICKSNNVPLVKVPSGIQPRCATGYLFSVLVKILSNSGILENSDKEITDTAKKLEKLNESLGKSAKILAKKLLRKIPVVYASNNFKALARIWKIKFNENSKVPAFHNYFPELNHNEMVGYTSQKQQKNNIKNLHIIILRDSSDHPRVQKRMELTANIIKKAGAKVDFVKIKEGSIVFKMFSSLLFGDWVSYYLAIMQKIDPAPVKLVEEFKKSL